MHPLRVCLWPMHLLIIAAIGVLVFGRRLRNRQSLGRAL